MKRKLQAEVNRLTDMLDEAEDKAGSENERTAERYETIRDALQDALDALDVALGAFDEEAAI